MSETEREMRSYRDDGPPLTPEEQAALYDEAMSEMPVPPRPTADEVDAMARTLGADEFPW